MPLSQNLNHFSLSDKSISRRKREREREAAFISEATGEMDLPNEVGGKGGAQRNQQKQHGQRPSQWMMDKYYNIFSAQRTTITCTKFQTFIYN